MYVLCAVCIVKLNYMICIWCCLAFTLTLSQCFWKFWVFSYLLGDFIYYWISGVRAIELWLLQVCWFQVTDYHKDKLRIWISHTVRKSWNKSGFLIPFLPSGKLKPALFKIFLGEAFWPAIVRWSLSCTGRAVSSEGLTIHNMDWPVSVLCRQKTYIWRSLCALAVRSETVRDQGLTCFELLPLAA